MAAEREREREREEEREKERERERERGERFMFVCKVNKVQNLLRSAHLISFHMRFCSTSWQL